MGVGRRELLLISWSLATARSPTQFHINKLNATIDSTNDVFSKIVAAARTVAHWHQLGPAHDVDNRTTYHVGIPHASASCSSYISSCASCLFTASPPITHDEVHDDNWP
jgi:hypothetical protein